MTRYISHRSIAARGLGLGAVALAAACAAGGPGDAEPLRVDLARFGIDAVVADGEGDGLLLIDGAGERVGRVGHEVDGDAVALDVEVEGVRSRFTWSDDGASLRCGDGPTVLAGPGLPAAEGEPLAACGDALTIAALVAAADGVAVPGIAAAPEVELRSACETVSATGDNCSQCRTNAYIASTYWEHAGGSCTQGWLWASCTHTYCDGPALEQHAQ